MMVRLVSPEPEDASFWLKVRQQKSTQAHNPMGVLSLSVLSAQISESNQELSAKKSVHRFFLETEANHFAGVIALRDINWESGVCELGYLVDEKFHGQGVATTGVRLILEKAFSSGIRKIKATTSVRNLASERVLQKNGFVEEGYLRAEFMIQKELHDVRLWAAHRDAFLP